MVIDSTLTSRLTSWAKARDIEPGTKGLDNLTLRDAARDLSVSFADIRLARDTIISQASLDAEVSGLEFRNELYEGRSIGATHDQRDAGASPLATRFTGKLGGAGGVRPRPTHELEAPRPELEALVDGDTGAAAWRRPWERLAPAEQRAVKTLGFGPTAWDVARDGSLDALPSSFRTVFIELPAHQREAVRALGFTPEVWDADVTTRQDLFDNPDILAAFTAALGKGGVIDEDTVRDDILPEARDWGVETQSEKRALLYLLDFHGHRFTGQGRKALRDDVLRHTLRDQISSGFSRIEHGSDLVVNDASGLEPTLVARRVEVRSPEDVRRAIGLAKVLGTGVSIAGRRHSEGGQSVSAASVNIDMLTMNKMETLPNGNLRVEAGATWAQVQDHLAKEGRAVKIMQSANIFSVGGSLAVNCHGRTPGEPPLISTIESIQVMTGDGRIVPCSRGENEELFRHAIGGYGLFGVILEVELKTRENPPCELEVELAEEGDYLAKLDEAAADPAVQLAWGRLAPTLNGEVIVHRVRKTGEEPAAAAEDRDGVGMESGATSAVAKALLHLSKIGPFALEGRWALEKKKRLGSDQPQATLSQYSSPNVELLNQYWFHEGTKTDILHEYYVPRSGFQTFIDGLRELQRKHGMNTLNCTLRDVGTDTESALPYAREDSLAFVLYFNQDITPEGDKRHADLTRELINLSLKCDGTFYLPYQKHYTDEQLHAGYPDIDAFFTKKRELDPNNLFTNKWYERYGGAEAAPTEA